MSALCHSTSMSLAWSVAFVLSGHLSKILFIENT
jgi:hypothetical protein